MIKKLLLSTIALFLFTVTSFAQPSGGSIKGKVLDETDDGFPFVNVALYQNGNLKGGAQTRNINKIINLKIKITT